MESVRTQSGVLAVSRVVVAGNNLSVINKKMDNGPLYLHIRSGIVRVIGVIDSYPEWQR